MILKRVCGVAFSGLLVFATAVQAQPPKAKPAGLPVKVAPVRIGMVTEDVTAVGTLLANESVMIRPEVAGRVAAIHFKEGQAVAAGARLVALDAAEVRAQLDASRADERLTEQRAERAAELFKKNFISQQALEDAREAYKKAAAQRRENEARLAKTDIRAPFAGIVGLRQVSPGAYLKAGDDIARLDKIDVMKLDFRVPELYVGRIRRGQPVTVRVDAFPGEAFTGRVYAIETAVDERTRTALLRGHVENRGGRLRPGMFARVMLELGATEKAVLVPEQAIVPRGGRIFVFRVIDGKAALTEVALGARSPGQVEIVKGVKPGERVVTDGQIRLQDGVPVIVLSDKPPPTAATAKENQKSN